MRGVRVTDGVPRSAGQRRRYGDRERLRLGARARRPFPLHLHHSGSGGFSGNAGVTVLFGSIFGLSSGQALTDAVVALVVAAALVLIARPLLFASLDEAVASAQGVPVQALGYVFFVLVGITAEIGRAS